MARIVKAFPVFKLWRHDELLPNLRQRDIVRDDVDRLMCAGPVQLVVAQAGAPLLWIPESSSLDFWRRPTEHAAFHHTITAIGQPRQPKRLPDYLCYPSEWDPCDGIPLILLEMDCWPSATRIPPLD